MNLHSSIPRIPFTAEKFAQLKDEYAKLLKEQEDLIIRVQKAREMGDLSENGAYKYGKIELGNVRRRLRELKHLITHGQVIHTSANNSKATFGSKVTIKNEERVVTFTLVSEFESDPAAQKFSDKSPIGKAVIGKKVGDRAEVQTPQGVVEYKIEEIS